MQVVVEAAERRVLAQALRGTRRVRDWRRYQAVVLLAEGQAPLAVAQALRASLSSVYNWAAAWRRDGLAGLHEAPHGGRRRRFDAAGEQWLDRLLASDPQAQGYRVGGWTVPLLQREAAAAGYGVSAATLRRTIHRLGWRWKRPKYVLGRPAPAYTEKKRPCSRASPTRSPRAVRSGSALRRPSGSSRRCGPRGRAKAHSSPCRRLARCPRSHCVPPPSWP